MDLYRRLNVSVCFFANKVLNYWLGSEKEEKKRIATQNWQEVTTKHS